MNQGKLWCTFVPSAFSITYVYEYMGVFSIKTILLPYHEIKLTYYTIKTQQLFYIWITNCNWKTIVSDGMVKMFINKVQLMVEWVSLVYFPRQIQVNPPFSLAVITATTIYLHCIIQIMHEIYVKIVKSIFLNYVKYMLCMHSKSLHTQCKYEFLIKFSIFTFSNCKLHCFISCMWLVFLRKRLHFPFKRFA